MSGRTAPLYPTSGFTAAGWTAAGWPVLDAGGIANLVALAGGTLVLAGLPPFASATGKDLLMAAARRWGQAVEEAGGTALADGAVDTPAVVAAIAGAALR